MSVTALKTRTLATSRATRVGGGLVDQPKVSSSVRTLRFIVVVASAIGTFGIGAPFADDLPPGVSNSQDPNDVSLTPQESLQAIEVPDGFQVTLFAGEPDLRRPIAFDFDDRGRLWVVENYSHPAASEELNPDRILIFEDTDNDGQYDKRKVFWSGGRYLSAIAYGHGGVWIGNSPELSFIPDRDRDDVPDSEPVVILDGFLESSNNVLNNFHWGPDGWLYGAIGLRGMSRVGRPGTPERDRVSIPRGLWRVHPTTHKFEVYAIGMVNPWGADFNEVGDLFTTNTVISHLWHVVPGMFLQRRGSEQDYRYAYGRIQSINDHLHWGGGRWTDSRQTADGEVKQQHSVTGGGHAHCGGMVYLGDNWPETFRGKFYTCNLHGKRVNCDNLIPSRSTYVATHGKDVLMADDPWFRGLSIKYGPDGGVFVSDWHDFGECHDSDGSHRTSGRIYKVVFGTAPDLAPFDLAAMKHEDLLDLHSHPNEWYRRHARRLLLERSNGTDASTVTSVKVALRQRWGSPVDRRSSESDDSIVLSRLWTWNVTGNLSNSDLAELRTARNQHVRRWSVRMMVDREDVNDETIAQLAEMATDPSAKVRLAVAAALQRIPPEARWGIAERLLSNGIDAEDPFIPLMIWYGIEPAVTSNVHVALRVASLSQIPLVRRYIARRLLDVPDPPIPLIITAAAQDRNDEVRLGLLKGMGDALSDRGLFSPPPLWPPLYDQLRRSQNAEIRSVAVGLARIFGDRQAIDGLKATVVDPDTDLSERKQALAALGKLDGILTPPWLHDLLSDDHLRADALRSLAQINDSDTPAAVMRRFSKMSARERQLAVSVLVTREAFAMQLFECLADGTVSPNDVSAFALQHLRSYPDKAIQDGLNQVWLATSDRATKADAIARYKRLLEPTFLATGNASAGRVIFESHCAKCHTLFGAGGTVGPDLTGSGRGNLDYVLGNLIDPSGLVDEAYRLTTIEMTDGRLLSGFLQTHGENSVVLRTPDAEVTLPLSDIDDIQTTNRSMMPDGLLESFLDDQVRDLVVYLASPDQVDLP